MSGQPPKVKGVTRSKGDDRSLPDRLGNLLEVKLEIEQTVRMIGLLASSASGNDLCRRLANDEILGDGTLGVQIYALTNSGRWQQLGSYGKDPFAGQR